MSEEVFYRSINEVKMSDAKSSKILLYQNIKLPTYAGKLHL